jgi:tetratricopeptide (TPR) repeat protein
MGLTLAMLLVTAAVARGEDSRSADVNFSRRAEFGVSLAMTGQYREAEIVFISLLASSPGDARALANLGNLRVLNGDLGVALAFYDKALQSAPDEAGIVLDRATVLYLMGDAERAEIAAARGMELAGGESQAAMLLGLPPADGETPQRAAAKTYVSPREIRMLLQAASRRLPSGAMAASRRRAPGDSSRYDARKPMRWRSAAPRASDGGEIASILYWKK